MRQQMFNFPIYCKKFKDLISIYLVTIRIMPAGFVMYTYLKMLL